MVVMEPDNVQSVRQTSRGQQTTCFDAMLSAQATASTQTNHKNNGDVKQFETKHEIQSLPLMSHRNLQRLVQFLKTIQL